uniref:Uncharacterized protein n=1 Tax=Cacopsylla melanoneura TaxID=428564 RepID=A0A8D8XG41_9HEMI
MSVRRGRRWKRRKCQRRRSRLRVPVEFEAAQHGHYAGPESGGCGGRPRRTVFHRQVSKGVGTVYRDLQPEQFPVWDHVEVTASPTRRRRAQEDLRPQSSSTRIRSEVIPT